MLFLITKFKNIKMSREIQCFDQSAMVYCASKLMEKLHIFWIII